MTVWEFYHFLRRIRGAGNQTGPLSPLSEPSIGINAIRLRDVMMKVSKRWWALMSQFYTTNLRKYKAKCIHVASLIK